MINWTSYSKRFKAEAKNLGFDSVYIQEALSYAKNLHDKGLPIIYDQEHLAKLIGIDSMYFHSMSNDPTGFYRTFYIKKRNGKKRRIDEPLPDLKSIQQWVLTKILYKLPANKFIKSYIPGSSIKDNARLHRGQKAVMTIDLRNYFASIKIERIIWFYRTLGYCDAVAVMLANLCCLNKSLPQGAPTSPYLSNLITSAMDEKLSSFAREKKIRYTRYADDIVFSGFIRPGRILNRVRYYAKLEGLRVNDSKTKIMTKNNRQQVTGIVVNEKLQTPRSYRNEIRKEIYYINKYGLDSHLNFIGETRCRYLSHLLGKINYVRFVNPKDANVGKYFDQLKSYFPNK